MSTLRRKPIILWLQMHPAAWSGWPSRDQEEPSEDQWERTVRLIRQLQQEAPHAVNVPVDKRVVNAAVFCRLTTLINHVRRQRRAAYAAAVAQLHLEDLDDPTEVSLEELTEQPVSTRRAIKDRQTLVQLGLFEALEDRPEDDE